MIISISGKPGSGKSTIGERLAAALGYRRYYVGGMRRAAAQERGLTLAEFNRLGEQSDATDREFDEYVRKLGQTEDNFVIESRTAFLFIPHSLKIYLDVSLEVGARRILQALHSGEQQNRNEGAAAQTYEAVRDVVRERIASDQLRYQKYYHVDIFDRANYDWWLDTTDLSVEAEFQQVLRFVEQRLELKK